MPRSMSEGYTGYQLARSIADRSGTAPLSPGRLYNLLAKLTAAGLVSRTRETSLTGEVSYKYRPTGATARETAPDSYDSSLHHDVRFEGNEELPNSI